MAELADATDLKSVDENRAGSIPAGGTIPQTYCECPIHEPSFRVLMPVKYITRCEFLSCNGCRNIAKKDPCCFCDQMVDVETHFKPLEVLNDQAAIVEEDKEWIAP